MRNVTTTAIDLSNQPINATIIRKCEVDLSIDYKLKLFKNDSLKIVWDNFFLMKEIIRYKE